MIFPIGNKDYPQAWLKNTSDSETFDMLREFNEHLLELLNLFHQRDTSWIRLVCTNFMLLFWEKDNRDAYERKKEHALEMLNQWPLRFQVPDGSASGDDELYEIEEEVVWIPNVAVPKFWRQRHDLVDRLREWQERFDELIGPMEQQHRLECANHTTADAPSDSLIGLIRTAVETGTNMNVWTFANRVSEIKWPISAKDQQALWLPKSTLKRDDDEDKAQ